MLLTTSIFQMISNRRNRQNGQKRVMYDALVDTRDGLNVICRRSATAVLRGERSASHSSRREMVRRREHCS